MPAYSYMPMAVGEERGYCTKFTRSKSGSSIVSGFLVQEWISNLVFSVFGPEVTWRSNMLRFAPISVGEPAELYLTLLWRRKPPGFEDSLANFRVLGTRADGKPFVQGSFVVIIPAEVVKRLA